MSTTEIPEVKAIRATKQALLILTDEGDEVWVPKSVIHDDSEVYEDGHEGTLVVQEWFAKKTEEFRGYVE
jgi:hypothetical protein